MEAGKETARQLTINETETPLSEQSSMCILKSNRTSPLSPFPNSHPKVSSQKGSLSKFRSAAPHTKEQAVNRELQSSKFHPSLPPLVLQASPEFRRITHRWALIAHEIRGKSVVGTCAVLVNEKNPEEKEGARL